MIEMIYSEYAMKFSIRLLYLYLFSAIGLLIAVFGLIRLLDLGLKVYVFNNADQYSYSRPIVPDGPKEAYSEAEIKLLEQQQMDENRRQRQREVAGSLAMILVGVPLYLYHWSLIKKEGK